MAILSTTSKAKVGAKAAKVAVKNPSLVRRGGQAAAPVGKFGLKASKPVGKLGFKAAKPVLKRRVRGRAERVAETARTAAEMLVIYGPPAAYELGLAEPPKPKRSAPRVAVGIFIGASAMYFLEPEHGREHREKVTQLVS